MTALSPKSATFIATTVIAAFLASHFAIVYAYRVPLTAQHLAMTALIVPMVLGWIGLRMLKELGRHDTVRNIRLGVFAVMLPGFVSLFYGGAMSAWLPAMAAAILGSAFVLALRARHAARVANSDR